MLANYLIGLREGLEAALVVSILVAYLVRSGHRDRLGPIWLGVSGAVAVSLAAGAILTFSSRSMSFRTQELFGGCMSVLAVCFVTWMVFWMRKASRHFKGDLQGKLDAALAMGTGALAATAFIAVGREGLETALFIWTAVQATGSSATPVTGAVLGLLTAVVLGYMLYRRSVKLNLAAFFRWTGAGLVVVAAGVLAYGFHDLQEAGVLTFAGLNHVVLDATGVLPPSSWWGALFKGLFSISAAPTRLELGVWLAYLIPAMTLFLRPVSASKGTSPSPGPRSEPVDPARPTGPTAAHTAPTRTTGVPTP
ncbi:MAG: FTR1 family protein [Actinomycetota bacterium]|nr:FTR1 family protein [Actinomycetota bacterium]